MTLSNVFENFGCFNSITDLIDHLCFVEILLASAEDSWFFAFGDDQQSELWYIRTEAIEAESVSR
ncbi:uncharacterized protein N7529_009044 [Penicillium soppii]|jgi:hypothetical protein|uniref:uncharacterized protein n=1 Tax=Penicillium soppii TaxID=69789 RepID=UPI0025497A7C|nr:uncharacterized protein N7529_009044 [Penicillium soppii]KAJ5861734.1 hypothetical protein N7529_009044 [Penicillium soppii]